MLYYLAAVLYVVSCLLLLLVVLLQQGKGGDMASAFGGGGSQAAFGAGAGGGGRPRRPRLLRHRRPQPAKRGIVSACALLPGGRPVRRLVPAVPAGGAPAAGEGRRHGGRVRGGGQPDGVRRARRRDGADEGD